MIDIVIVNIPGTIYDGPLMAPALLKATVERAGFTCKTIDYNAVFHMEQNYNEEVEKYFLGLSIKKNNISHNKAQELINNFAADILTHNPKYVGISVFTYNSRVAAEMLAFRLREISQIKIILGGQGVIDSGTLGPSGFGQQLLDKKIIDYYICSEGEVSLVELLKGNIEYPGINSHTFQQVDDLDSLPWPDYSDYQFEIYNKKSIPALASRGCVRNCSFCDIHGHWEYRFRNGEDVANEMIYQAKKHNIQDFTFGDSLINGSLKQFKRFIARIAEYNRTTEKKLKWTSQFIVRSSNQLNEEYWQNLADSGAYELGIGVETGSDRVRMHMNKRFTNVDLDYTMEKLEKYNVTCIFLIITGYPTETKEDFQDTLDMFTRYQKMGKAGLIIASPGAGLGILPGTPLYMNADKEHIQLDTWDNNWIAWNNLELDAEERIRRRQELVAHLKKLGYPIHKSADTIFSIFENKKEYLKKRQTIMIKLKTKHLKRSNDE